MALVLYNIFLLWQTWEIWQLYYNTKSAFTYNKNVKPGNHTTLISTYLFIFFKNLATTLQ